MSFTESLGTIRVGPYVAIARVDHWFKNVFVLPGIVVALSADHSLLHIRVVYTVLVALVAMGLVASSYYVLNEILDASQDALHPLKKNRPIPSGQVNIGAAYVEWAVLGVLGLLAAHAVNRNVFMVAAVLWLMACIYNVRPIRTKDRPYLDVLSESINNPLRLLLGWYCTGITALPPISLMAAYWMVGAFFMAVKRYAEYRQINDPARAAAYRRSFAFYTEERLLVSTTYYAVAFGLCFGIFLVRYRMELILSIPLIAGFIAWYIHLGFLADSPAQTPERLFRQRGFTGYSILCIAVMIALMFINIPDLPHLFEPTIPSQLH